MSSTVRHGNEQILLHHVADAAAQAVYFLSAVKQSALIGINETCNDVEDGGFAAAAWPDDADEVPFVNVERQAIENLGLSLLPGKLLRMPLSRSWTWGDDMVSPVHHVDLATAVPDGENAIPIAFSGRVGLRFHR